MKLAHIVNPVNKPNSDLVTAQPITYETMRIAQFLAENNGVGVEHWSCFYPEDEKVSADWFNETHYLDRSVADVKKFSVPRKLPLFRDILDRLYESTDADYMIQTNVDIGLMPHFYLSVKRFIEMGYDALIINKRIISKHYDKVEQIPEMYCDLGTDHNGCDCFVFRRDIYPKFDLGDICMGTPWSETTLVANMVKYSKNCEFLRKTHLTFHIGDERSWIARSEKELWKDEYRRHNTEEFAKCLLRLSKDAEWLLKHPIMTYFIKKMKLELQPHYAKECHELCAKTLMLF
jgi:hypothetical protein